MAAKITMFPGSGGAFRPPDKVFCSSYQYNTVRLGIGGSKVTCDKGMGFSSQNVFKFLIFCTQNRFEIGALFLERPEQDEDQNFQERQNSLGHYIKRNKFHDFPVRAYRLKIVQNRYFSICLGKWFKC